MKLENLLQVSSIIIASISFGICMFLWGQINGFEQGMLASNGPTVSDPAVNIVVHGPNFFEVANSRYLLLAISFYAFLIGRLVRVKELTYFLCFSSLVTIFIVYWQLFGFKYSIDVSAVLIYRQWLSSSIVLDWLCMSSASVLMFMQIVTSIRERNA